MCELCDPAYVFALVEGLWPQTNFYKAFNADAGSAFAGPPGSVAYRTPDPLIFCETQATTSNSIPNSGAVYIFDNSEGQ